MLSSRTARVAAVVACGAGLAGLSPCAGEPLRVYWTNPSDTSVDVVYGMRGGQSLGGIDVEEDAERVTVSVQAEACLTDCGFDDEEVLGCATVELDDALGSRELIDGSTDRPPDPIPQGIPDPRDVPCTAPP